MRQRAPTNNWHVPIEPDWPELIQRMPNKEIDKILARINTK